MKGNRNATIQKKNLLFYHIIFFMLILVSNQKSIVRMHLKRWLNLIFCLFIFLLLTLIPGLMSICLQHRWQSPCTGQDGIPDLLYFILCFAFSDSLLTPFIFRTMSSFRANASAQSIFVVILRFLVIFFGSTSTGIITSFYAYAHSEQISCPQFWHLNVVCFSRSSFLAHVFTTLCTIIRICPLFLWRIQFW